MDTTTSQASRDSRGIFYDAPAWSGDLKSLTDQQLFERTQSLGRHIGALTTVYEPGGNWHAASPTELRERQFDRWIGARLAALREQARRESNA